MKKLQTVILLTLCALLLWGCNKQAAIPDTTASTDNLPETVILYYNLDVGTMPEDDANGVRTFRFATGDQQKTFTVKDPLLAQQLQLLDFVGLTLDGDTVTGLTRMPDLPYQRLVWSCYVQSMGGSTVKFNTLSNYAGREIVLSLPEGLPIYDITSAAPVFGAQTNLQKNDCVSLIAGSDGKLLYGYVTNRPAIPRETPEYCKHCDREVLWSDWTSATSLPQNDGHYILQTDVSLVRHVRLTGGSICLDLNGKTVTQTTFGQRIYDMAGAVTLSILDSAGNGVMIPNSSDESASARFGMVIYISDDKAELNLYGGTLDGSNATSQTGCVVSVSYGTFNMYGGTILGGTVYGTGSSAVTATGNFNLYDGRIVGGKHIDTDYEPLNPPGGAAIRVLGTTTIYGGIIEGGESYTEGGVIRLTPDAKESGQVKLILKGGTITGGKSPIGGGIYAKTGTTIILSGDVNITGNENGNLYLEESVTLIIDEEGLSENARIGLSMARPGIFVTEGGESLDLSKYFFSDDPARKLVSTPTGWSLR